MTTHKLSYYHNGRKWSLCHKSYSLRGDKRISKLWKDVTCLKCLAKRDVILQKLQKALENISG